MGRTTPKGSYTQAGEIVTSAVTTAQHFIAVVDDEAPVRTMLRRVLRLAGYEVVTFASGDDFFASLAKRIPACVVVDLHMPGMTGLEVVERLRQFPTVVPVVCITASDDAVLDKLVIDACGVPLLRKPFASDSLLCAVAETLR